MHASSSILYVFIVGSVLLNLSSAERTFRVALRRLNDADNTSGQERPPRYITQYYGTIRVGTPPQLLSVGFDTQSENVWVAPNPCFIDNKSGPQCRAKVLFNPKQSVTWKKTVKPWYLFEVMGGFYGTDTVMVGDSNNTVLRIEKAGVYVFEAMNTAFDYHEYYGTVGLGIWKPGEPISLMSRLIASRTLKKAVITISFNRNENSTDEGSILFGDVDTERCKKDVHYSRLQGDGQWSFKAEGLFSYFPNNKLKLMRFNLNIASASRMAGIEFTQEYYDEFMKNINHTLKRHEEKDFPYVPCETDFTIKIQIRKRDYYLKARDLMTKHGENCVLHIFSGKVFALGDPFIRKYCHVYDYEEKRIGFSRSRGKIQKNKKLSSHDSPLDVQNLIATGDQISHLLKDLQQQTMSANFQKTQRNNNQQLTNYLIALNQTFPFVDRIAFEGRKLAHVVNPARYPKVASAD